MKKIIGIIAAVAMAASVFAVDFSGATKIGGSLFNYDGIKEKFSVLKENNDSHDYANPNFSFSISDDKAGASLKFTTDGGNYNVALTSQTIWFKPIDMLKVSVGHTDTNLNQESITWGGSDSGIGSKGFSLALTPVDGLEIDVFLTMVAGNDARGAWWIDGDGQFNELSFKVQYGADFGTVNAIFQAKAPATNKAWEPRAYTSKDMSDLKFGAGYKNTFSGINVWANVLGYLSDSKFTKVRPEAFANGSADKLSWAVFLASNIPVVEGAKVDLTAIAKVSYAIDPVTVYLQVQDNNILADDFAMTIKPGVSGNCGLMGWDIAAQLDIASKISIDVPVSFSVSF